MYLQHFGFSSFPFSISADRDVLFLGQQYREAAAHMHFSLQHPGGIILLTGEVGTGKTTLARNFLSIQGDELASAFVVNPRVNAKELLQTICDEFGIQTHRNRGIKYYIDAISVFLLEQYRIGKRSVILIDEAQHLDFDSLEHLRLLTNIETKTHKLVQVILVGQEELRSMLADASLRQFSQRIVGHYHLQRLDKAQTSSYIKHRLATANGSPKLIPQSLHALVYAHTNGVPRLINVLCDRALIGAYALDRTRVDRGVMKLAIAEIFIAPGIENTASTTQSNAQLMYVGRFNQCIRQIFAWFATVNVANYGKKSVLLLLLLGAYITGGWLPVQLDAQSTQQQRTSASMSFLSQNIDKASEHNIVQNTLLKQPFESNTKQQQAPNITEVVVAMPDGNTHLSKMPQVQNVQSDTRAIDNPQRDIDASLFDSHGDDQTIPDVAKSDTKLHNGQLSRQIYSQNVVHKNNHTFATQNAITNEQTTDILQVQTNKYHVDDSKHVVGRARKITTLQGFDAPKQLYAEYSKLLELWNDQYSQFNHNSIPCIDIHVYGLTCVHIKTDITQLEKTNMPAIIEWQDGNNTRQALVIGVHADEVLLWRQGEYLRINKNVFVEDWDGHSHYFIQAPHDFRQAFRLNDIQQPNSQTIAWLVHVLGSVDAKYAVENVNDGYNDSLIRSVKRFQQQHGLIADGIVGFATLALINTLVFSSPTLTTKFD